MAEHAYKSSYNPTDGVKIGILKLLSHKHFQFLGIPDFHKASPTLRELSLGQRKKKRYQRSLIIFILYNFRANKSKINAANMLEIGASLAKALWYLQDRNIVHSNIRCRNVFVAKHGTSMTVKLSDTGVPDYRSKILALWQVMIPFNEAHF